MIFMGVECYGCQQTKKLYFPFFSEGNLLHLSWSSLYIEVFFNLISFNAKALGISFDWS